MYHKRFNKLTSRDYAINRLLVAASSRGVTLKIYTPDQFDLEVDSAVKDSILLDGKRMPLPDFVLPRMGVGTSYFALAVLRQLVRLGVYCCNHPSTIEYVTDKLRMHEWFVSANLPTPKTMLVKCALDFATVRQMIGYPMIVKRVNGTDGIGTYLCESEDRLKVLLNFSGPSVSDYPIILQEFIQCSFGKDLRVFVIGGRVVGCVKRVAQSGFKANFSQGARLMSYPDAALAHSLALEVVNGLNLDVAGVDLLFDRQGYKVCEANSSPGFQGIEHVLGVPVADYILDFLISQVKSSVPCFSPSCQ